MDNNQNQAPPPIQTPPFSPPPSLEGIEEESHSKKKVIAFIAGGIIVFLVIIMIFIFLIKNGSKKNEKVVLQYWGAWEEEAVFRPVFDEFQKANPNITVVYKKQDVKSLGKYVSFLRNRIENNTGPDLFRFHNSWVLQIRDILSPLPVDVVAESQLETQYYNVIKTDMNLKGAYYGIPIGFDTLALFVNNQILKAVGKEAPKTLDELLNLSAAITVKDQDIGKIETSGVALGSFDNIAHASEIISYLLIQNGAYSKKIDSPYGAQLGKLEGQSRKSTDQALEYYTFFAKGEGRVWDANMENSKLAFSKGNLAMYFGYSWDIPIIKSINPTLDFSIVPLPPAPGADSLTIASYWAEGVSAKTKYSKEAFLLLKFLTKKETLQKLYSQEARLRSIGELYPRRDMKELLASSPLAYPFLQHAEKAKSTLFSSDTYDEGLNDALNGYLGNAIRSIISGGTSVESAVDTLSQGVSQIISKYSQ